MKALLQTAVGLLCFNFQCISIFKVKQKKHTVVKTFLQIIKITLLYRLPGYRF